MEKKITVIYNRKITTPATPQDIISGVTDEFEEYGEILDINVSDPLKVIGAGRDGNQSYQATITIAVDQDDFGELEKFANRTEWEKPRLV